MSVENIRIIYGGDDYKIIFLDLIRNFSKYLVIYFIFILECLLYNKKLFEWIEIGFELKNVFKWGVEVIILFGKDKLDVDDLDVDDSL